MSQIMPSSVAAILLAIVIGLASAETGGMRLECPSPDWTVYRDPHEVSCMRLMPEPKHFNEAFKACFADGSRLLSLSHKRSKLLFVNDMIVKAAGENHTLWFFDPLHTHHRLVKHEQHEQHLQHLPPPQELPDAAPWLVISPSSDRSKIELVVNMTAVPRSFICEAPARPAAQRPQLAREPEDVFISEELLRGVNETTEDVKQSPPFIVTFNCQAYGLPKPTVQWVLTGDAGHGQALNVQPINATVIHSPKLPLSKADMSSGSAIFFNLQRDCRDHPCPTDSIQERSQLIVVNPQYLGPQQRIACVANNDFGSVLSREAQVFVAKLDQFAERTESVTVKAGTSAVVQNAISAEPDAAFIECFRALDNSKKLVPFDEVNRATDGGIQLSRATFELIIDAAGPSDAGKYLCQARVPNGRLGHVTRERTISLEVQPCLPSDAVQCDLSAKPVSVAEGYPVALSTNPLARKVIRAGDDFMLECPCTGKRHPKEELLVKWNLNNRTDLPAQVLPTLPRGSALMIQVADSQVHTGLYECQCVRGSDVSAWSSVNVSVLSAPTPVDRSDVVRVKVGQNASLECRFQETDPAVSLSVQPLRGDKPLADALLTEADAKRFAVARDGNKFSLTIDSVNGTDADVYGCRVMANYRGQWVDYNTYYTTLIVE